MAAVETLAALAARMNLSPIAAVALPETITVAARKLEISEDRLVAALFDSPAAADYVASVCREVAR